MLTLKVLYLKVSIVGDTFDYQRSFNTRNKTHYKDNNCKAAHRGNPSIAP